MFYRGIVDDPKNEKRKQHGAPIAYLGGVAIFLCFLLVAIVGGFVHWKDVLFLGGLLMILLLGLIDDIWQLKPRDKLVGQMVVAGAVALGGIGVHVIVLPWIGELSLDTWIVNIHMFGYDGALSIFSSLFTFVWLIFCVFCW